MTVTLPPEIRDAIIDELEIPSDCVLPPRHWSGEDQENLKALRTLLFVSRESAIRARHHLFWDVHLSFMRPGRSVTTFLDMKRLRLFSHIVTSSVGSNNRGVLPHIRNLFLFCNLPPLLYMRTNVKYYCDASDGVAAKYCVYLSNILKVLLGNATRIGTIFIDSNDLRHYREPPPTFDVKYYWDWNVFPKNVQQEIYNLIHCHRLEYLTVRQFINLPPDFLVGAVVENLNLDCTPSSVPVPMEVTAGGTSMKAADVAPPITRLYTPDYLLPQVTSLCDKSSKSSIEDLQIRIPIEYYKESHQIDRYEKLGQTITYSYPSLTMLALDILNVYPECPEGRGLFELPTMPIDIRGLQNLIDIHIEYSYCNINDPKWFSASGNPSGPLRNIISILTHCPDTLKIIRWKMEFDFCQVRDPEEHKASEYGELDELIDTKFQHLEDITIESPCWPRTSKDDLSVVSSADKILKACNTRLKKAFPRLEKKGLLYLEPDVE